jgi:hypothetical protein
MQVKYGILTFIVIVLILAGMYNFAYTTTNPPVIDRCASIPETGYIRGSLWHDDMNMILTVNGQQSHINFDALLPYNNYTNFKNNYFGEAATYPVAPPYSGSNGAFAYRGTITSGGTPLNPQQIVYQDALFFLDRTYVSAYACTIIASS